MSKWSLKNYILSFIIKKRISNINNVCQNPINTQKKVFLYLISKAKNTSFGKMHNFKNINNYTDFKNNIPIRDYEGFYKFIKETRLGKKNVIWPGKINWYAKSSGTTNSQSKFIPITKESLKNCHFKAGKDMLSLYENNFKNTNIYNGKGLMLGGGLLKSTKNKYKDGDLSAILLDQFPYWVNYHRIPDIKTAIMKDWERKIDRIAKQAIKANITNITGVPSWMLILLKRILTISNKKHLLEVWPNLELYMHGGVNFEPYRAQFKKLIPSDNMNYLEGYNASEGFLAIQDQNPSKGLLLMLDYGIFFEFIPMDKFKKNNLDAISLKDVKTNTNYALVITTNGGLWRYLIGDVICFDSLHPFRIRIIGRTKSFLNAFGEELIVENTDDALFATCKKHDVSIKEYTVAPLFMNNKSGKHQWFIEFVKEPKNIKSFIHELDYQLKKQNSDYKAKRSNDLVLGLPEIIEIKNNEFYKWLKKYNRLGGQHKIPRLSNNRKIANEIIDIIYKFSTN